MSFKKIYKLYHCSTPRIFSAIQRKEKKKKKTRLFPTLHLRQQFLREFIYSNLYDILPDSTNRLVWIVFRSVRLIQIIKCFSGVWWLLVINNIDISILYFVSIYTIFKILFDVYHFSVWLVQRQCTTWFIYIPSVFHEIRSLHRNIFDWKVVLKPIHVYRTHIHIKGMR